MARVVGIDNCAPAIEDARANAALNGIANAEARPRKKSVFFFLVGVQ